MAASDLMSRIGHDASEIPGEPPHRSPRRATDEDLGPNQNRQAGPAARPPRDRAADEPQRPSELPDPFHDARLAAGVLRCPYGDEEVLMLLRHEDVRQAARDWKTFSSDAPFRVPVPSEEDVRTMRQLPIEADPPDHTDYRRLVEPFFMRAREPAFVALIDAVVDDLLDRALARESLEVVHGFALPLQCRALAVLLDVPQREADIWVRWGLDVLFEDPGGDAPGLEAYHRAQFDRAEAEPGGDFFSVVSQATFRGRRLTREEMMGFANLTFAGGRDTIIHTVACAIGHLAAHPQDLEFLRTDPARIVHACEEFFRVFMPLTHIGRICPVDTVVHGATVPAGARVSLGWASANLDEAAFSAAREVRLDRRPNPHVSFGFGPHLCLGAAHSRTVLRCLLGGLCRRVAGIEVREARERLERTAGYERPLGYESLVVAFRPSSGVGVC
jgi:cytochrome P450